MRAPVRRLAVRAAVLMGCAWTAPAAAQATCDGAQPAADPGRVAIAGGRVSLVPPPQLTRDTSPAALFRHEMFLSSFDATFVTVRYSDWAPDPGSPAAAELLAQYIELRSPDIEWIRRDVVELEGTRWLRFEYTYRLVGTHLFHVHHYAAAVQGRGVHVELKTPPRNVERVAQLASSAATLRVRDCPPAETAAESARPAAQAAAGVCRREDLGSYPNPADPRRVETPDGRVSLVPAEGMRAVGIPPRPNAPTTTPLAFSDDSGTSISVMVGGQLPPVDSAADVMAAALGPKVGEVIGRGVVDVGGTRWARLEFTGQMEGTPIYNLQYMTPYQGRGVVVSFLARADGPEARARLARSAATLKLVDCALPHERGAGGR
jgi:hypothetical protein